MQLLRYSPESVIIFGDLRCELGEGYTTRRCRNQHRESVGCCRDRSNCGLCHLLHLLIYIIIKCTITIIIYRHYSICRPLDTIILRQCLAQAGNQWRKRSKFTSPLSIRSSNNHLRETFKGLSKDSSHLSQS